MRGMWTIAWKDFRSVVNSPLFFLLAGLMCVLTGFMFLQRIFMFAQESQMAAFRPDPSGGPNIMSVFIQHISILNLILIFAMPVLTMRLLAEEKKMRTYDLLLTAPVTATQIALGKFLAGFGLVLALLLISAFYPLVTAFFTSYHFLTLAVSYLGLALLAAIYVACGLFASSLTESPVGSAFVAMILNLSLWFISSGSELTSSPLVTDIMSNINIGQHIMNFIRGTINVHSIVFMVSSTGLFIFLTQRVVESSRWR